MLPVGLIIVLSIGGIIFIVVGSLTFSRCKEWLYRDRTNGAGKSASLAGNLVREVPGKLNDNYKLSKNMLGRGASAECYIGTLIETKRDFAIKVIDTRDEKVLKYYEKEIQILKELEHTNIVRLYEVYRGPNTINLVMELCVGGHLGEVLNEKPEGRLEEYVAQAYIAQLVGAVAHCHSRGICHRDIKLQNILLDTKGRDAQIKLIDFGHAKKFEIDSETPVLFTKMAGTTYTMAPEVFKGEYDERCDIWSIGIVCFIILSGQRPFENVDIPNHPDAGKSSLVANILMGRYNFYHPAWDTVSEIAIKFTQLCLTVDYHQRPRAAELRKNTWCVPTIGSNHSRLNDNAIKTMKRKLSKASSSTGLGKTSMIAVAFSMPPTKAKELRTLFQQIDKDGSGLVDIDEFRAALSVSNPEMSSSAVDALFNAIDQDGNQHISFLEFVASMLDPKEVDIGEINQAFKLLDVEEKGYITHEDIYRLLATSQPTGSRNVVDSKGELGSCDELKDPNGKSPRYQSSNNNPTNVLQNAVSSFKRELSTASLFQRGASMSAITKTQSKESVIRRRSGSAIHGKDRINSSGNIVLKQNESDENRMMRMQRIHMKVKAIIEQADQDGDGKISYSEFLLAMTCENGGKSSRKSSGQFSEEGKSFRELRKNGSFVQSVKAGLSRFSSAARIAVADDMQVQNYDAKLSGSIENV